MNTAVWIVLFAYRLVEQNGSFKGAVRSLPPWHFQALWLPGVMSGILFSIGEFASIIAVAYLGQGVGNTFVQCKIIIAGLWGLLYYKYVHCRSSHWCPRRPVSYPRLVLTLITFAGKSLALRRSANGFYPPCLPCVEF